MPPGPPVDGGLIGAQENVLKLVPAESNVGTLGKQSRPWPEYCLTFLHKVPKLLANRQRLAERPVPLQVLAAWHPAPVHFFGFRKGFALVCGL
eukprot:s1355_g6.t1